MQDAILSEKDQLSVFKHQNDLEIKNKSNNINLQDSQLIKKVGHVERVSYSIDGWSSVAESN